MRRFIAILFAVVMLAQVTYIGPVSCTEEDLKNIFACITAAGLSDVAAAAMVGNAKGESGGRPDASEGGSGGKGIGIFQWSTGNRDLLVDHCSTPEHSGHAKVTLKGYTICNRIDCQVAFMLINSASAMNGGWSKYYNSQVAALGTLKSKAAAGEIPASISGYGSMDGFKAQTSLEAATIQFLLDYERPTATSCFWVGNKSYNDSTDIQERFVNSYKTRYGGAKDAFDKYSGAVYTPQTAEGSTTPGTPGVPGGSTDLATGVATQLYSAGYFTEAQLASYCSLTETNLEDVLLAAADVDNLRQKDLEGLTDWERNHQADLEEHGYISILRWLVALVGILMTIWALFVYLAFWFDHINSFFYMDVLHILTFGQLHICPPGDKPTFSLGKKVKTRTVSHRQILGICLTAILFGSMLISGVFYQIVSKFVNLIMRWLK